MIESINNAIRSDDDLANRVIVKFWNYSADLRKLRQHFRFAHEKLTELKGFGWGVSRNIADNAAQIAPR